MSPTQSTHNSDNTQPMQMNLSLLHKLLDDSLNDSELRNLCFNLKVDYETLPPGGKSLKAQELVSYMQRDKRLPDLLHKCAQLRPNTAWMQVVQNPPEPVIPVPVPPSISVSPRVPQRSLWYWPVLAVLGLFVLLLAINYFHPFLPAQTPITPTDLVVTNLVKYFDLQSSAEGWTDVIRFDEYWKNPVPVPDALKPPIPDERGVAYDLALNAGKWWNYVVKYPDPMQADVIVAHVYLSSTAEIEDNWVGIQATDGKNGVWLARSATEIPLGEWRTLVFDLRDKYDFDDKRLSDRPVYFEVFFSVLGRAKLSRGIIRARLDDVVVYKPTGDTAGARPEKRGAGRTLFDFEDETLGNWQLAYGRAGIDTIGIASDVSNRGRAIQWNIRLMKTDDKSFLETKRVGPPPQGGVVARIFLPDSAPDTTSLWVSLYASTQGQWRDSKTILLRKGQWNTITWDTRNLDWAGMTDVSIGIQIGLDKGSYQGPIYVDDVEIFDN